MPPVPPRRPVPGKSVPAKTSGLRPRVPARTPVQAAAPEADDASTAAPARPAAKPKRRIVARSSSGSDGFDRILFRLGAGVAIAVIGLVVRYATKPANTPDRQYFERMIVLEKAWERRGDNLTRTEISRQVSALPIGGVSDPKLREYHQALLSLMALPEEGSEAQAMVLLARLEVLTKEINKKYAR